MAGLDKIEDAIVTSWVHWGRPWHGLVEGAVLTLPNDLTRDVALNTLQPSGVCQRGDCILFQIPGIPETTLATAGLAEGMRLDNYALLSGFNHILALKTNSVTETLYEVPLGNLSWLYLSDDGIRWRLTIGNEGTVTAVTDETVAVSSIPDFCQTAKRIDVGVPPVVTDSSGTTTYALGTDYTYEVLGLHIPTGSTIAIGNILVDYTPIEWVETDQIAAYDPLDMYIRAERFGDFDSGYEVHYFHATLTVPGTSGGRCTVESPDNVKLRFEDATETGSDILLAAVFGGTGGSNLERMNRYRWPLAWWKLVISGSGSSMGGVLTVACSAITQQGTIVTTTDPRGHLDVVMGMWFNAGTPKKILLDVFLDSGTVSPPTSPAGERLHYRLHEEGSSDYSESWAVRKPGTGSDWETEGGYVTTFYENPFTSSTDGGDCNWQKKRENGYEIQHNAPFLANCSFFFGARKHGSPPTRLHGDGFMVVRYSNHLYGVEHIFADAPCDSSGSRTGNYDLHRRYLPAIFPGGITTDTIVVDAPNSWGGTVSIDDTCYGTRHPVTGEISRSEASPRIWI